MRATLIDGTYAADTMAADAHRLVTDELLRGSIEVRPFVLNTLRLGLCQGCFGCWVRSPGRCQVGDDGNMVTLTAVSSQLLVFLTPVTFGGYSGLLKRSVDRLIPNISPFFTRIGRETAHRQRYNNWTPNLLAVGLLDAPDPDAEQVFSQLVQRNGRNFYSPQARAFFLYRVQGVESSRLALRLCLQQMGVIQ